MRAQKPLRAAVALVAAIFALAAAAAAAHAASPVRPPHLKGEIALFSDPYDYVGRARPRLFTSSNATIVAANYAERLVIDVNTRDGQTWILEFDAPPRSILKPGLYARVKRAGDDYPGVAGIDVSGESRGCNENLGWFQLRDLSLDRYGHVRRVRIELEQHCETGNPALFGQISLHQHRTRPAIEAAPSVVRWPARDRGYRSTTVPVTFIAGGDVQLHKPTIAGRDARDFSIAKESCSGATLHAGGRCHVRLDFTAARPGARTAALSVRDSAGHSRRVPMEGFVYGGRTRLVLHSDPGDPIGGGVERTFTTFDSVVGAIGTGYGVFGRAGRNGEHWIANFGPVSGHQLAPGHWDVHKDPSDATHGWIEVGRDEADAICSSRTGTVDVGEATFFDDGYLRSFGASFTERCADASGALHGTFDFRAGSTTPLPPWMRATPQPRPVRPSGHCAKAAVAEELDRVRGTRGGDDIPASGSGEAVFGGRGADRIWGLPGSDCLSGGPGDDYIDGGPDNLFDSRDDSDYIDCGSGDDTARVSASDVTRGCERVVHGDGPQP